MNMLFSAILLILTFITVATSNDDAQEVGKAFLEFQTLYHKYYSTVDEQDKRFQIFQDNYNYIKNFNADEQHNFTVGINEFADLTHQEFREKFGSCVNITVNSLPPEEPTTDSKNNAPNDWDWRSRGAVTPVKNQAACGACWAFSATGCIEGGWFIKNQRLVGLSEQNLVDCSVDEGNGGCAGGLMTQAYQYIIKNQGIETESTYPYTATGPNRCKFNRNNVGATIRSYKELSRGSESQLLDAVYQGPVSIAIDATKRSFQFYTGGVYYDPACSSTVLDHAVLAVGYGSQSNQDYWIVKNSWGPSWGQQGYVFVARNRQNHCGVATAASYAVI